MTNREDWQLYAKAVGTDEEKEVLDIMAGIRSDEESDVLRYAISEYKERAAFGAGAALFVCLSCLNMEEKTYLCNRTNVKR